MSLRYWRLRKISTLLSRIFSGNQLQQSRAVINLCSASSSIPVPYSSDNKASNMGIVDKGFYSQRYSTVSQLSKDATLAPVNYILSFIESKFDELQGPNHCWLNKVEGDKDRFNKDGTFLVLAGQFLENSQIVSLLEKLKSLHQKFPQLCIMGFHCGASIGSVADQTNLAALVMKEYITFPILLSNKKFLEMENEACYILFKDFRNPVIYQEKDLDLGMINKEIEEWKVQQNGNLTSHNLRSTWVKQADVIKEPDLTSSLQNSLLYFPGCISADESGDRLFLSDSNHHRIVILDRNGKIMDCVCIEVAS